MMKIKSNRILSFLVAMVLTGISVFVPAFDLCAKEHRYNDFEEGFFVNDEVSDSLINYIAISDGTQSIGETQKIVVGIGNGDKNIKKGILTYKNSTTKELYVVRNDDETSDALYFEINYEGKSAGVYELVGVQYVLGGETISVKLLDIGIDVKWGVDKVCDATPDAVVVDEDEPDVDCGGTSVIFDVTTNDGTTYSSSSIEEAIESVNKGKLSISSNNVNETKLSNQEFSSKGSCKADYCKQYDVVSESGLSVEANVVDDVSKNAFGKVVVVLDPGHGGSDSGACGFYDLRESDINLKIANYCKAELEKYSGVDVRMTRVNDSYVGLEERTDIAKSCGADLFVSIHINSASESANGVEVWYPNANYNPACNVIGAKVSQDILDNIVKLGLRNRGIKIKNSENYTTYPDGSLADYYSVIRTSKVKGFTGIIVEHAFISNPSDAARLADDNFLKLLGIADAEGIASALGLDRFVSLEDLEGAFDVNWYRFFNQDLWQMNDYQCLDHWLTYGIFEDRDGSPVFNMIDYINNNEDLVNAFGFDFAKYAVHFSKYGMSEGRKSKNEFSVLSYKNQYPDLRTAFLNDLRSYYMHYANAGWIEGRSCTGYENTLIGKISSVYGVDYSAVYDFDCYKNMNSDIKKIFNNDDVGAILHFINYGMNEGRQASDNFNVDSYAYRYKDLRNAFCNNKRAYYIHYMNCGRNEGRVAIGCNKMLDATTVFNGIDYSSVYNYTDYVNNNIDIKNAFGYNDVASINHFVSFGMREGRVASDRFDVNSYKNKYLDLRRAFGNDLKSYYIHYIDCGRSEGRIATGCNSVEVGEYMFFGVYDMSPVYDYRYYQAMNPDIKAAFGNDDIATLVHFINYGMKEGRIASQNFNVYTYKNRYEDLHNIFGNDLSQYYYHYINFGKNEGRSAV